MVVSYGSLIASKLSHLRLPLTTFFGSHCHKGILHRVAQVNAVNVRNANINSIYNQVSHRFSNFLIHALKSDLLLIQTIYQWSTNRTFTAPSFNNLYNPLATY